MPLKLLVLILVSVLMSSVAQLLLKIGMSRRSINLDSASMAAQVLGSLLSQHVLGGLALYGLGTLLWLAVLSKLDVSLAYPFVGLGFVMTMLFGYFVLGEQVTLQRVAGTLLIVVGVALVARSTTA